MDSKWERIIVELWNSKATEKTLKIAPPKWRDDLKSHIFEIIVAMDKVKLIDLEKRNELDKYFWGIVQTQWKKGKSNCTSSFWKTHKMMDDGQIIDPSLITDGDNEIEKAIEEAMNIWDGQKNNILDRFWFVNKNSINYFFNRKVFELYYFEGMTLQEISSNTGISYETIRKSIIFTKDWVKKELLKKL